MSRAFLSCFGASCTFTTFQIDSPNLSVPRAKHFNEHYKCFLCEHILCNQLSKCSLGLELSLRLIHFNRVLQHTIVTFGLCFMCLRQSLFHQDGFLFSQSQTCFVKMVILFLFILYEPAYDTCASKHQVFLKLENRFCTFNIVFQRQSCFCSARILIYSTLSRSICRSKVLMYWCCFLSFFFAKKKKMNS